MAELLRQHQGSQLQARSKAISAGKIKQSRQGADAAAGVRQGTAIHPHPPRSSTLEHHLRTNFSRDARLLQRQNQPCWLRLRKGGRPMTATVPSRQPFSDWPSYAAALHRGGDECDQERQV